MYLLQLYWLLSFRKVLQRKILSRSTNCTCISPLYSPPASSQYKCEVWWRFSMSKDSEDLCGTPTAVWHVAVSQQDLQALWLDVHSLVHNTALWNNRQILIILTKFSNQYNILKHELYFRLSYHFYFWATPLNLGLHCPPILSYLGLIPHA
jgi:hypothetical protein